MKRRFILSSIALGAGASLGGCIAFDTNSKEENDTITRPYECPVTQDFAVSLPDEVTNDAVRTFVRQYEEAYIANEETWMITYDPSTAVREVNQADRGIIATVETVWAEVHHSGVRITAEPQETMPDTENLLDVESLPEEADPVATVARDAVDDDAEATWVDETKDHKPIVAALEPTQDDDGKYHVTVEETAVRIRVSPEIEGILDGVKFAWYYLDEAVVRRTDDSDTDPSDGDLLECFPSDDR